MKTIAFSITLLSLFILLLLIFLLPAKSINSPEQLSALLPNQKITTTGKVIGEKYYKNYKIFILDNSLELRCDINCPSYLNKTVSALAITQSYNNKNYLNVLKIKTLDYG